jgi:dihydrofolate reductase
MRPLRFSVNVTLDGCVDHRSVVPDEELHRRATAHLERADALLFGRVTYQLMEDAFRSSGRRDAEPAWTDPFARAMDAARKHVVSSTLDHVDWNAELVRGDLASAVRALKDEPGDGLFVAGATLARGLTELGLIDEYEFVVHPTVTGHGPSLFAGLAQQVDLRLVGRHELGSGAVALTYEPAS